MGGGHTVTWRNGQAANDVEGVVELGAEDGDMTALVSSALSNVASDLFWISRSPRHLQATVVRACARARGARGTPPMHMHTHSHKRLETARRDV